MESINVKGLVIGYGSIGKRHTRVLQNLGCSVAVASRRATDYPVSYNSISQALTEWKPDYIVIASRTHEHFNDLNVIGESGFQGSVMVEKPLFDFPNKIPGNNFVNLSVAYNLRFHPLIQSLKVKLKSTRVITATIYAGSYLPSWRPEKDYRLSYSSSQRQGGGVLRDLSHELDYATWLFGAWQCLVARGGRFSTLEIDSDDSYSVLLTTTLCPLLTIQVNYLDRHPRREIIVNTDQETISVDLISNHMTVNGIQESIILERDYTYKCEHQAAISGQSGTLCSAKEGQEILTMIEAIEQSASQQAWVQR
jgi:predicted dehydrogenase